MNDQYLILNFRDQMLRLNMGAIVYIAADGNYCRIVSCNRATITVTMTMQHILELIDKAMQGKPCRLVRIGKSCIINLDYIYRLDIPQQLIVLSDQRTFSEGIKVSAQAIRDLREFVLKLKY